ncbi:PepSY domain-containing protein [Methylopila sp. M107]|uniref:PepSY domain-containing protein n=1 Tax=Methylopila sp. M107 TaxID=1101190 RepID=UPI000364DFD7|nr:PepSY domain-containing protein [Methylopila sp. M107]
MKRHTITIASVLLIAGVTAAAAETKNDAPPGPEAATSMQTAIATAEQHVKGKAVRAEYERRKGGGWVYDIEVRTASDVFDVTVDPDKGAVIASIADKADLDDDDAED